MPPVFSSLVRDVASFSGRPGINVPGRLEFDVAGIDAAIANGLRRSIMSDVITAGFRFDATDPAAQDVRFSVNTSPLHNEFIGERVGLIPIHLPKSALVDFDPESWSFELDVANDGPGPIDVTTENITVSGSGEGLLDAKSMFPPDPITGHHAVIAVLMPNQRLVFEAKASLGSGRDHARFNPSAACVVRPADSGEGVFHVVVESQCGMSPEDIVASGFEALASRIRSISASADLYPDAQPQSGNAADMVSLRIDGEDDTAGAVLQAWLLRRTAFAGYYSPHPLERGIVLRLVVPQGESARDMVRRAASDAADELESVIDEWRSFSAPERVSRK